LVARARTALRGEPPPGPAPVTSAEEALVASVLADAPPPGALSRLEEMHAVTVVAVDRPGLLADIAGTLAAFRLSVRSALVRTVPAGEGEQQIARDHWWVDAGSGEMPSPQTLETGLRRLADGDRSVLDRLAR